MSDTRKENLKFFSSLRVLSAKTKFVATTGLRPNTCEAEIFILISTWFIERVCRLSSGQVLFQTTVEFRRSKEELKKY